MYAACRRVEWHGGTMHGRGRTANDEWLGSTNASPQPFHHHSGCAGSVGVSLMAVVAMSP